eukprot:6206345-Pleurochrysis_carterae.AAC.3
MAAHLPHPDEEGLDREVPPLLQLAVELGKLERVGLAHVLVEHQREDRADGEDRRVAARHNAGASARHVRRPCGDNLCASTKVSLNQDLYERDGELQGIVCASRNVETGRVCITNELGVML